MLLFCRGFKPRLFYLDQFENSVIKEITLFHLVMTKRYLTTICAVLSLVVSLLLGAIYGVRPASTSNSMAQNQQREVQQELPGY